MTEDKAILTTTKGRHSKISDFAKSRNIPINKVINSIIDFAFPLMESGEVEFVGPVEPELRFTKPKEEAGA